MQMAKFSGILLQDIRSDLQHHEANCVEPVDDRYYLRR